MVIYDPLGKTEDKRRRGWQRLRWLDSITHSMDMNLSKLQEILKDRGAWSAAVHGIVKSQTQRSNETTTLVLQALLLLVQVIGGWLSKNTHSLPAHLHSCVITQWKPALKTPSGFESVVRDRGKRIMAGLLKRLKVLCSLLSQVGVKVSSHGCEHWVGLEPLSRFKKIVGLQSREILFKLALEFVSKYENTGWSDYIFLPSSFARGCEHRWPRDGVHGPSASGLPQHVHGPRGSSGAAPENSRGSHKNCPRHPWSWMLTQQPQTVWHPCAPSQTVWRIVKTMYWIPNSVIPCFCDLLNVWCLSQTMFPGH